MVHAGRRDAPEQVHGPLRPPRVLVLERHPGEHEDREAHDDQEVHPAVEDVEAVELHARLAALVLVNAEAAPVQAFLGATVDVERRVHRGEGEDDRDERDVEGPEREDRERRARILGVHVDLERGEVLVGARMTAGTRRGEILLGDRAGGVRGGDDAVAGVAVGAHRGLRVAESEGLAVVAVQERAVATAVTLGADGGHTRAEGLRAGREDVMGLVAVGAQRSVGVLVGEREGPVERALVHECLVGVTVLAGFELGGPQPVLGDGRSVHARVETDVAADAGELAVAGGGVHGLVDVDALPLAIDVDVRVDLLAIDIDGAVHGLLPVARHALFVARWISGRAGRSGVGAGRDRQRRDPEGEHGEHHAHDEGDAPQAQSVTLSCS